MSDTQDVKALLELEEYSESQSEVDSLYDPNEYMSDTELESLMTQEEKEAMSRWRDLRLLQQEYADARDFLTDVLRTLIGATPTDIQYDMIHYLQHGAEYAMIQAQRGEAKTTITGIFAVWRLIQDPTTRVLIFSAGGDMSEEISNWIIQVIFGMEILECLRPDTSRQGQRASVKRFDVHYHLKGFEKSPSVACMGVTANMQGRRADLLIPDDIESSKNALTELMREQLRHKMRDFPSICSDGRIVYLGTPQSSESVYNQLPALGFDIRVWTGRYPTEDEEPNYNGTLAPIITERMAADPSLRTGGGIEGNRGQAVDPGMFDEAKLCKKELAQGPAYFNLQHMLDTRLSDAGRFPLKVSSLAFWSFQDDACPTSFGWAAQPQFEIKSHAGSEMGLKYYRAANVSDTFLPYTSKIMAIDPAGGGQNGDETGYCIIYFLHGYCIVRKIGGIPGGVEDEKMLEAAMIAKQYKVNKIIVEKNYGYGAYAYNLRSVLQSDAVDYMCIVEEVWHNNQKEKRIADTLEPVIGRHHLIFDERVIEEDWETVLDYPLMERKLFSLFWQMSKLTLDKDSLKHDDRLDALAIGVAYLVEKMGVDAKKITEKKVRAQRLKALENPLGYAAEAIQSLAKLGFSPGLKGVKKGWGRSKKLR